MGRQQKRKRSASAIAKDRFPVGELAKRRKAIREEYLMNCETFQTETKELKKAVAKVRTKTIYFPFSLK